LRLARADLKQHICLPLDGLDQRRDALLCLLLSGSSWSSRELGSHARASTAASRCSKAQDDRNQALRLRLR